MRSFFAFAGSGDRRSRGLARPAFPCSCKWFRLANVPSVSGAKYSSACDHPSATAQRCSEPGREKSISMKARYNSVAFTAATNALAPELLRA